VGGAHRVGVDGRDAAGHQDGEQAPMADEQPGEGHPGGAGQQGENPADGQSPGGTGPVAQQRGRAHQQGDAGRLHEDELAIGHGPVHQPDRAAEVWPVVVLGDAEQEAGASVLAV